MPLVGTITDALGTLRVTTGADLPFTMFVFWPEDQTIEQVMRFARDVVPAVRQVAERYADGSPGEIRPVS